MQRTPYVVIIGDEELSSSTISLRSGIEMGAMALLEVIEKLLIESNDSIFE